MIRQDADGDLIEPSEVYEVREAAKRCIEILKDANDWMSGATLRRLAELNEYCVRNWVSILGLIGDHIEINDYSPLPRYRYYEMKRIKPGQWNNTSDERTAMRAEAI